MTKIQRNEQCPCGSELKFKFCHGKTLASSNEKISCSPFIQIPDFKDSNSLEFPSEEQHYQNTLKLCDQVDEIRRTKPNHILNSFQTGIFNEVGLNDPEVLRIKKIASQIREGIENVNGGGCGLFALLLQTFVGGEIYHICLAFKLNGEYPFYGDHDFLIKNGICYDADCACQETTLIRYKQPMRRTTSEEALRRTDPKTTYCLYNVTKEKIIAGYKEKQYLNCHCTFKDKVRMVRNAKRLTEKMKNVILDPEIEKLFPSNSLPQKQRAPKYFEPEFWVSLIRRILGRIGTKIDLQNK